MVSIPDWSRFGRMLEVQHEGAAPGSRYRKHREKEMTKQAEESGYITKVDKRFIEKHILKLSEEELARRKKAKSFLDTEEEQLDLSNVFLVRLPGLHLRTVGEIGMCRFIRICILCNNYIIRFDALDPCHQLLRLDLHSNQIQEIPSPSFWATKPHLRILNLHDNPIGTIDTLHNLSMCHSLLALTLYDTPLSLKRNYRHHVVNSIWSLKALDNYVISDEEIIEDAQFGDYFCTMHPNFAISLCPPLRPHQTFEQEVAAVNAVLYEVNHINCHNSPVLILQRWFRGHMTRKALRSIADTRTWAAKKSDDPSMVASPEDKPHPPSPASRIVPSKATIRGGVVGGESSSVASTRLDYDTYMAHRRPGSLVHTEDSYLKHHGAVQSPTITDKPHPSIASPSFSSSSIVRSRGRSASLPVSRQSPSVPDLTLGSCMSVASVSLSPYFFKDPLSYEIVTASQLGSNQGSSSAWPSSQKDYLSLDFVSSQTSLSGRTNDPSKRSSRRKTKTPARTPSQLSTSALAKPHTLESTPAVKTRVSFVLPASTKPPFTLPITQKQVPLDRFAILNSRLKKEMDTHRLPGTPVDAAHPQHIYINLTKLQTGKLSELDETAALEHAQLQLQTPKVVPALPEVAKRRPRKKKSIAPAAPPKPVRIKDVREFFGPVVETILTPEPSARDGEVRAESTMAGERDQGELPIVEFKLRLKGIKQRLQPYDPMTEMIIGNRDAGRDIRAAEYHMHEYTSLQPEPIIEKSQPNMEKRIFNRVQGTMGFGCLRAVEQAYKDRAKAEKNAQKQDFVMSMRDQKEAAKERVRLFNDEKRSKTLKEREKETKKTSEAIENRELQRIGYIDKSTELRNKSALFNKSRRGELTFISDFNAQNTSVSNALLRHDRLARKEDKLQAQTQLVQDYRHTEQEQKDVVKKYMEHRTMMRQTESALARAALDSKMLREANDQLMEAKARVAQRRQLTKQANEVTPFLLPHKAEVKLPPVKEDRKNPGLTPFDRWGTGIYVRADNGSKINMNRPPATAYT